MQITAVMLELLLALTFLASGGQKLIGAKSQKEMFAHLKYPQWFMYVAGLVEVVGALGMLVGLLSPIWAFLAGLLLVAQMIGALVSHIRVKDARDRMIPPSVLLMLAVAVIFLEYPTLGL